MYKIDSETIKKYIKYPVKIQVNSKNYKLCSNKNKKVSVIKDYCNIFLINRILKAFNINYTGIFKLKIRKYILPEKAPNNNLVLIFLIYINLGGVHKC